MSDKKTTKSKSNIHEEYLFYHEKYKKKYGFEYVNLVMSKDLSDSVRDHGIEAVRDKLFPLLKQAL